MKDLTLDYLRKAIDYDPDTGAFSWRARRREDFKSSQAYGAWLSCSNSRPGNPNGGGYVTICLGGKNYLAHRLAWFHFYGEWPAQCIDHVNGDKTDNRLANLRDVSNAENHRNIKRTKANKSGVTGVVFQQKYGTWRASIRANGRCVGLGSHPSFESAIAARRKAEAKFGYHPNHGLPAHIRSDFVAPDLRGE